METKELKIIIPEGYEIDKDKSSFEKIIFKKKEPTRWRDCKNARTKGYYLDAGEVEPKKLKREKVKEVLLSFRRSLQQVGSEYTNVV